MMFRSYSIAAIAAVTIIGTGSFLPTTDAAAGYPLVREAMIFNPLSCNSNLEFADCSSTSLESIIDSTTSNSTEILIPCGTCATLTTADGSTLDLSTKTINIEGKLHVPPSAHVTIRTRGIFIQGELKIDPPSSLEGLRVQLVGVDDVLFVPNDENADRCDVEGCNEGSKPVVVAGGHLNVRGDALTNSPACKTWTTLKDVHTTNPILPNHPSCMFDGSLLEPEADGTFESSSKAGFTRYRWGSVEIASEDDGMGGTNTYLHNYGRSNVKDGLQINLGDRSMCAMKNRMYRMSFKYRLHTPNESHRPTVELDFKDRHPRKISYDLPESVNGTWAQGSFEFLSYDLKDKEIANVKVTWPTDDSTSNADYDDISILPILVNPPGLPDVFYVDTEVAQCWVSKVGTELLITTNEIGSVGNGGWDGEDIAVITHVDVVTGAIIVVDPIAHYKTTELQDARFATEVALLHRSTIFEAVEDNVLEPWIGGHSVVKHTLVPQLLSGVAFENFGQQGQLGRYPIHFHMAGDHPNSTVSKNLVRNSNQRCVVIHGTDSILVEENVAYDTVGHCFINENGVEEDIRFIKNLGALTHRQPEERRIGNPLESDHRAYTFWFTNANVRVEGNVAAGAHLGGFWYETFEHAPHGPYADWPEYADFNPKLRPFGSFIDNAVHSSGERGIRMYEPGYKPLEEFTFYNTRAYKNNEHGIFIHGVEKMTLDGGVFADNKVGVRNFNDRTIFKNLELIVTSDLVRERNPDYCESRAGIQQRINPGWGQGSVLENVTFSGINEGFDCGQKGFEFYHLLGPKRFIGKSFLSGVSMGQESDRGDLVVMDCRWKEDPYNIENIIVEDPDGTIGLTGLPGFYVSDSLVAKAFIAEATCVPHPRGCADYCNDVCLRNVEVKTVACGAHCFNYTMRVSDGLTSFDYPLHIDQSDDLKHSFEAVLPEGVYEISFYNQDGILDDAIEPDDVTITLGEEPQCANHLVYSDIRLKTKAPTPNPTTVPLLEPLYSDTILSPLDPTEKLGLHKWTSDPQTVISGKIVTYSLYQEDRDLPALRVTPSSQHSCSIVQGLKLYTSATGSARDPNAYKLEGRFDVHDEWSLISEGPISLPSGRNVLDEDVSSALHFGTVQFNNFDVYREYRLWMPSSSNNYWVRVGALQFTGFFTSCSHIMEPPTPFPTSLPTPEPTLNPIPSPTPAPTDGVDGLAVNTIVYPATITSFGCSKVVRSGSAVDPTTEKYVCVQIHNEPTGFVMAPAHGKHSIAKEMRLYTANNCPDCDCVEYKLEGRVDSASSWQEIGSGNVPWTSTRRNARGLNIISTFESGDDSLTYAAVDFPGSSVAYLDYKFTCIRTRGELVSKLMLGSLELAGYLLE